MHLYISFIYFYDDPVNTSSEFYIVPSVSNVILIYRRELNLSGSGFVVFMPNHRW